MRKWKTFIHSLHDLEFEVESDGSQLIEPRYSAPAQNTGHENGLSDSPDWGMSSITFIELFFINLFEERRVASRQDY